MSSIAIKGTPSAARKADRLESLFRHDRGIIVAALCGITGAAWWHMLGEARGMQATGLCQCLGMAMSGPDVKPWTLSTLPPLALMWAEMMVAMMVPSAAPMILTFARVNHARREQGRPFVPVSLFLIGYLLVWSGFGAAAALAQWGMHGAALLSPGMKSNSPLLGGALLLGAGIFQWTPWKRGCLQHCRSPLSFLLSAWREGRAGAITMGLEHGAYCAGCCWLLMLLLFVVGVMNMLWVAVLSLAVLLEKVLPQGGKVAAIFGALLCCWGIWMMAGARWVI